MPIKKAKDLQGSNYLILGKEDADIGTQAAKIAATSDSVLWVSLRNTACLINCDNWDILILDNIDELVKMSFKDYEYVVIDGLSELKDLALPDTDVVSQRDWLKMGTVLQTVLRKIRSQVDNVIVTCTTIVGEDNNEYMAINPDLARRITGQFGNIWYVQTTPVREKGKIIGVETKVETNRAAALKFKTLEDK